jgi:hypothetical protein
MRVTRYCPFVTATILSLSAVSALAAVGDPFPSAGIDVLASELDLTISFSNNSFGLPVIGPTAITATGTTTYTRGDPYASPSDGRYRINANLAWAMTSTDLGGMSIASTGAGQMREVTLSVSPGHFPADSLMEAVLTLTLDSVPGITVFAEDSLVLTASGIDTLPMPMGTTHAGLGWLDEDVVSGNFEDLGFGPYTFPMVLYVDSGSGPWTVVGSVSAASHAIVPEPACAAALLALLALNARRK